MSIEGEIDAVGLRCPLPVLRLRQALERVAPEGVVVLLASDGMAAVDVPHFCAEGGHGFLVAEDRGYGVTAYRVRRGG